MTDAAATAGRDARLAWLIGGSLLTGYAVLVLAVSANPMLSSAGAAYVLTAVWVAALLLLALGVRRSGSVVGRQPVGMVAMIVAAVEPVVSLVLWMLVPLDTAAPQLSVMIGQGLQLLSLAALVVATVVIGRAGAVPPRLRWVPLIVLAVAAGSQILVHVLIVASPDIVDDPGMAGLYWGVSAVGTVGILVLGILLIVAAPRETPVPEQAVQVYPPAE